MKGFLPHNPNSFFTGKAREDGLRLQFQYEDHVVFTDITITKAHQSFENVVHGGILFGILDTIIWNVIFMETGKITMTRKTDMDFLKPVTCNITYRVQGKVVRVEDRDVWATAWIEDGNKEVLAQLNGLFREVKKIDRSRLVSGFDFSLASPEIKAHFEKVAKQK
jgi:uncharacterized protein (TIGR00369 family)